MSQKEWLTIWSALFVRYADDNLIFCKSRRGAERVCEGLTNFIEKKLHLKVNREKTEVGVARERFFHDA